MQYESNCLNKILNWTEKKNYNNFLMFINNNSEDFSQVLERKCTRLMNKTRNTPSQRTLDRPRTVGSFNTGQEWSVPNLWESVQCATVAEKVLKWSPGLDTNDKTQKVSELSFQDVFMKSEYSNNGKAIKHNDVASNPNTASQSQNGWRTLEAGGLLRVRCLRKVQVHKKA